MTYANGTATPTAPPPRKPAPNGQPKRAGATVIRSALLPIGVFLLVLTVGLSGYTVWRSMGVAPPADSPDPPVEQPVTELSRPGPPGWTREFSWVEEISPTSGVAVGQNRIATINANGSLVVLTADLGKLQWASPPVIISPKARPVIAEAGGVPVAAIVDDEKIYLAPLQGPAKASQSLTEIPLSPQQKVSWTGGTLLVYDATRAWTIVKDFDAVNERGEDKFKEKLQKVELPAGEKAMAAGPGDEVAAAPDTGDWSLTGQDVGTWRVSPEPPEGAQGEPHPSWSARGVVFVWWGDRDDTGPKMTSLHDVNTGEVLAAKPVSDETLKQGMSLEVSPDGSLATAGPLLANLTTGRVVEDDDWASISAPDDSQIYGTRNGRRAVWNGEKVTDLDQSAAVPWGTAGNGLAIVLDRTADGAVLIGGLKKS